jgi:CspA family cold shock protein
MFNTGKVKFFNSTKGYGFIIEDETGLEYFCHISKVNGVIEKDDNVKFELETSQRGPLAKNVEKIN